MIDYTNPAALQWWHKQMDNVLDLGIDGWKCDGTDPYILEFIEPLGYNGTITWQYVVQILMLAYIITLS